MAAIDISKFVAKGAYGDYTAANCVDVAFVAADVGNGNAFVANDNDLVIAYNSGGVAYTVTISSTNDQYGRTKDVNAYSLGAGEYAIFGPFKLTGWVQSTGKVLISANNAAVKFIIVQLPG